MICRYRVQICGPDTLAHKSFHIRCMNRILCSTGKSLNDVWSSLAKQVIEKDIKILYDFNICRNKIIIIYVCASFSILSYYIVPFELNLTTIDQVLKLNRINFIYCYNVKAAPKQGLNLTKSVTCVSFA